MKKVSKRITALVLSAIMLVSLFGTAAFASNSQSLPHYEYYTVLGDSNASGYGLDAYFDNAGSTEKVKEGDLIEGSYPALFADAIGADTVDVRSHCAWRTNEFLYTLLGDKCDVPHDNYFMRALDFVTAESLVGENERIRNAVEKADIISVDFGSNDIYSYSLSGTYSSFSRLLDAIPNPFELTSNPSEFFSKLINVADSLGILQETVDVFKSCLDKNTASFEANMVKVIDVIRSIKPEAKIVVVGVFCPISFDLRVNHQVVFDFKSSSDKRIRSVNNYLRELCKDKGCSFVDVRQTECFGLPALDIGKLLALDDNVKYSAVKMVHPTNAGHAYIAKQIITVMKSEAAALAVSGSYSKLLKRSTLKWNKVDGANMYRIYRAVSEDGSYSLIGTSLNTTFVDLFTVRGRTYYYKVLPVISGVTASNAGYSMPVSIAAK